MTAAHDAAHAPDALYLIDGHAQIFRAYHAIRSLTSPKGEPTNATFGFVGMLLKLWREQQPRYIAMALDVSGDRGTFRSQLDPQYKATRDATPEDLGPQVDRIAEICRLMGIAVLGVEGFEADDVIATVCRRLADQNIRVRIVSKDKDLHQLIGPNVELFDIHTDTIFDLAALREGKGVEPEQVVDMLALMGDNVDNIPGVVGIGPKTAAKLISQYQSIDNLLEHVDELTPKQRENVEAARDRLALNRQLVTLRDDVPLEFTLNDARVETPDLGTLAPIFRELNFTRHLQELRELGGEAGGVAEAPLAAPPGRSGNANGDDFEGGLFASVASDEGSSSTRQASGGGTLYSADSESVTFTTITTEAELADCVQQMRNHAAGGGLIAFDTETTSLRVRAAELCGLSFAWTGDAAVYIPVRSPAPRTHLDEATALRRLRPLLEDESVGKMGQNLKYDLNVLRNAGVKVRGVKFDTMVASFLVDAARGSHGLDNLAAGHLDYHMIPITDLIGRGRNQKRFDEVPLDQAAPYAAEDAMVVVRLHAVLAPKLRVMGLVDLFESLEMPLVEVLAEMEYNGIAVDADELDRQREAMAGRIDELRRGIIDTAGVDFNPDSPRQLADVLFNTLKCTVLKRRKTGPSTDSEVLNRIALEQAPPGATVAQLVLEYRQLTKLRGTYLEALKQAIEPSTGRIHASFNQTGASTGRLSSHDPNLQNIPIRTEEGRAIRKAFIAPPGHVLLAADYSQIELRLLAHLSGDAGLIEAFKDGLDIHAAVAAEVFGVPVEQVDTQQRGAAKMVNFGIVYGITPFGLARRLGRGPDGSTDVDRARRIIDDYKKRYPRIDAFLDRCVAQAETRGYVQTILKRRRPIPEIQSRNGNVYQMGRRMAINSVVQGSAADLIKLAMVNLQRRIDTEQRPMKMLVQIHDELVFEIPEEHVEAEAAVVQAEMTGAMDLTVPLKVDIAWGPSWFEGK